MDVEAPRETSHANRSSALMTCQRFVSLPLYTIYLTEGSCQYQCHTRRRYRVEMRGMEECEAYVCITLALLQYRVLVVDKKCDAQAHGLQTRDI